MLNCSNLAQSRLKYGSGRGGVLSVGGIVSECAGGGVYFNHLRKLLFVIIFSLFIYGLSYIIFHVHFS
jgi:hypothetical protein